MQLWPSRDKKVLGLGARLAASCLLAGLATCSSSHEPDSPNSVSVSVQPDSVSGVVGSSLRLEVSVLDEQGNAVMPPPVTWVSSDSAIASVASDGMVHLKAAGRAEVRARYKDQADSALVVVREAPVSSVEIAPDSTNLTVGNAIQFHANIVF